MRIRAIFVEAEGDDATLRAVLDVFRGAVTEAPPAAEVQSLPSAPANGRPAVAPAAARRAPLPAGSPSARVLELAKTPVAKATLLEQAGSIGLKAGTVSALIAQLVASRHLTRSGKSRATRYVAR